MMRYLRWLLPGLSVKRWIFLAVLGVFMMGLGISLVLRVNLYARIGVWLFDHFASSANVFLYGPMVAGIIALLLGAWITVIASVSLVRSVLRTLLPPTTGMAEAYYQRRNLVRGPRVVAIGGGTGMPSLLRGIKHYTSNIHAVVTVADDGGSSGRLREEFGILPPGDIRNCLVALSDTEPLLEELLQHRFTHGDGLMGHSFGNLLLLATTEITGNFYDAVQAASQVLAVRGRVLPSTLDQVVLSAELADGRRVSGESLIGKAQSPIQRAYLEKVNQSGEDPMPIRPLPDVLKAIAQAEVIVLGPGSLYTSIIPNLLVPGVAEAVQRSSALKIYVCNIMTEPGETDGYSVSQHVKALLDHAGSGIIDLVVANNHPVSRQQLAKYQGQGASPVRIDAREVARLGVDLVQTDLLADGADYVRHDPEKLARVIGQLFLERAVGQERTPWDFYLLRQHLQMK
jgi:uncharacterized cofD-like protein